MRWIHCKLAVDSATDGVSTVPARYSIIVDGLDGRRKVAKIWFGSDGSYYVSSPYHNQSRALLTRFTINYARQEQEVSFSEVIDSASVEDERHALKLSHHPDGFLQFSGSGVLSGRGEDGTPLGVGLVTGRFLIQLRVQASA